LFMDEMCLGTSIHCVNVQIWPWWKRWKRWQWKRKVGKSVKL
jgi:hypothetical protein